MLTDCCGGEEEAAASYFQPLGEAPTSKLGHCISIPQRASASAEGINKNAQDSYVRRKKPRADGPGGMDGKNNLPANSNSLNSRSNDTLGQSGAAGSKVMQGYEAHDDELIEYETRVHPLAAKELEMVEEAHPCTKSAMFVPTDQRPSQPVDSHFSFARIGIAKVYRGVDSFDVTEGPVTYTTYGEDLTLTSPLLTNTDERWGWLLAVLDGHGLAAQEAVALVSRVLVEKTLGTADEVVEALGKSDAELVRRIVDRNYTAMEQTVMAQEHIGGGTTCSSALVVKSGNRHFLVVSNVGDSPVLLVNNVDGRVSMLSGQHAWDNKSERAKYIERCNRRGLTPREVCYGRINAGGMVMEDLEGRVRGGKPLHMYHPGTAELDLHTRDHLCNLVQRRYRVSIGGSQSVRRFTIQQRRRRKPLPASKPDEVGGSKSGWFGFGGAGAGGNGGPGGSQQQEAPISTQQPPMNTSTTNNHSEPSEWSPWENIGVIPEYGHLNWGPTVLVNGEGKIQVSRSLGDREEKMVSYIWAEPDLAIYEFPPEEMDVTLILCSDGAADLWWFHQMGEVAADHFRPQNDPSSSSGDDHGGGGSTGGGGAGEGAGEPRTVESLAKRLYAITMEKGMKTSGYGEMKGRPVWDDLSFVVGRLTIKGSESKEAVDQQGELDKRPPPPPPAENSKSPEAPPPPPDSRKEGEEKKEKEKEAASVTEG